MGQTASQIENHIEDKREDLSQNLRELEYKVKSVSDWRHQFENHPAVFLGAALGGGMLLGAVVGRSSGDRDRHYNYSFPGTAATGSDSAKTTHTARANSPAMANSPTMESAMRAWENIKGALIGVAASRLTDYVDAVIPGFSSHYRQADLGHKY